MRFIPGTLFIALLACSTALYSQSISELTERNGTLARALLRGCDKLAAATVDFDGSGDPFHVEWWRCGGKNPNPQAGRFPLHYVVIRPPSGKSQAVGLTITNAGISDEYFIDGLQLFSNAMNSRQLLLISGRQYHGPERTDCLVEYVANYFECSPNVESSYSVRQELRPHEKSFFRKLDERFTE